MANKSKSGWKTRIVIFLVVGGVVAVGLWYFGNGRASVPQYQTAAVARGDVVQAVTATGQLNPVVNIQVGSQISGTIKKIFADYNSEVKSNQVIAQIDPATYQVAVQRAEAQLANARANLTLAKVQAERAQALFTNNLIAAADHDTALAQFQQAQAQVQSDEAALQSARVDLSRCTIYAPVDGVVISRNVDVGQTVAASFNTPTLFLIANDLSKMHIDALVSEADIGGVTIGQNANFTVDAFPYRTFRGNVSQIRYGAITNQNVVNYDCVIDVNNDDLKLLPGMTASVSIIIAEHPQVLKVPNAALRFRPPEAIVTETNMPTRATNDNGGQGGGFRAGGERGPRGVGGPGAVNGMAGPGGAGGPGAGARSAGGPGNRPRPERSGPRTVYLLKAVPGRAPELAPIKIKTGISDGAYTEVQEGLNEGDQVVTGLLSTTSTGGGSRPTNPFGGGFRRF